MMELETLIRPLIMPRNGAYPRPWMTDSDPSQADVLIVGASSAKTFRVADVGSHDEYLDGLFNRNGRTCRAMYKTATTNPSPTRPNLDRLSDMLARRGLTSLQTNVSCASAPYDAQLSKEDRAHGTEIFKVVVEHVPWRAMIVYGVGPSESFGRALGVAMPSMPSPDSEPAQIMILDRPVYISPTLASPGYRTSVWPYLERVLDRIPAGEKAALRAPSPTARVSPMPRPREQGARLGAPETPEAFNNSAANQQVWQRMHAIEKMSGLTIRVSNNRARLDGPVYRNTARVFRHEFHKAIPEILVRDDVFAFDSELRRATGWTHYKVFQKLRTDNFQHLARALDAVEAFAKVHAP